jgi:hypothetical protein
MGADAQVSKFFQDGSVRFGQKGGIHRFLVVGSIAIKNKFRYHSFVK